MAKRNDGSSLHETFGSYGYSIIGPSDLGGFDDPEPRGPGKSYGGEGASSHRMSQTEVALRLARHLAESPLMVGDVYLQLGGAELTRRSEGGAFKVGSYLSRWGYTRDPSRPEAKPDWIGFYSHKRHGRRLLLNFDKFDGHVMAVFAAGRRLIVHCSAGNLKPTQSPSEIHDLNRAVGRAVSWHGNKPDDVIAVCIPRSERFRKLTAEKAAAVGIRRAGVRFLHVDRGGGILGLGEDLLDG